RVMDPERALAGLGRALDVGDTTVVVADVDWERFLPTFTARRPSPLLSALLEESDTATSRPGAGAEPEARGAALVKELSALSEADRRIALRDLVRDRAASVLGRASGESVAAAQAFRDIGFDSLTAVELRNQLTQDTGLRLPSTLVYDYPTPGHLADHLGAELFPAAPTGPGGPFDPPGTAGDDEETALRRKLSTVPLARLKESGLLTALLALAEPDRTSESEETAPGVTAEARDDDLISTMDVDDLVQLALGDSAH
ncbi:beta-ketoacyl reductase, partial [Streptomyces fagopyri]